MINRTKLAQQIQDVQKYCVNIKLKRLILKPNNRLNEFCTIIRKNRLNKKYPNILNTKQDSFEI